MAHSHAEHEYAAPINVGWPERMLLNVTYAGSGAVTGFIVADRLPLALSTFVAFSLGCLIGWRARGMIP